MKIEVEQKFAVEDFVPLRARLIALGARLDRPFEEHDTYYAHPARDFAVTDEALRIRRTAGSAAITYKGPRLGQLGKNRRELELPLGAAAAADHFAELLSALGFTPVADVVKTRTKAAVEWKGEMLEVALDEVAGLGRFVELEKIAADDEVDSAHAAVTSLAAELGLSASERRSYLEMLLAGRE